MTAATIFRHIVFLNFDVEFINSGLDSYPEANTFSLLGTWDYCGTPLNLLTSTRVRKKAYFVDFFSPFTFIMLISPTANSSYLGYDVLLGLGTTK